MKFKTLLSAGVMVMAVSGTALAAICGAANPCAAHDKHHQKIHARLKTLCCKESVCG